MSKKTQVRKNSSIFIFRPIADDIALRIWEKVGNYQHQDWKVPNDRSLLASIAGDAITDEFYGITDTRIQNIALRNIMREPLHSMDRKRRNAAIKWIVYN